jgi:signal peptidase II
VADDQPSGDSVPANAVPGDVASGDVASGNAASGDVAPVDVAPGGRSWRRAALLVGIALVVLTIDQITKAIVAATIDLGENIRILGGLVYLTQIRNAGAAFSMATGMTWVLAIIALAVVAFIVRMAPKLRSTPWAVCLGLVLGGALGNLCDRIFRAPGFLQGHVVDFISVFAPNAERFPAFNAADSAITVGGIMLVLIALLGYDFDGTRHRGRRTDG